MMGGSGSGACHSANRAPDPLPDELSVAIAPIEHQVGT
jgi:hypothetical protein